jgi:hypothetical protein
MRTAATMLPGDGVPVSLVQHEQRYAEVGYSMYCCVVAGSDKVLFGGI